jgi:hypothetical protein
VGSVRPQIPAGSRELVIGRQIRAWRPRIGNDNRILRQYRLEVGYDAFGFDRALVGTRESREGGEFLFLRLGDAARVEVAGGERLRLLRENAPEFG